MSRAPKSGRPVQRRRNVSRSCHREIDANDRLVVDDDRLIRIIIHVELAVLPDDIEVDILIGVQLLEHRNVDADPVPFFELVLDVDVQAEGLISIDTLLDDNGTALSIVGGSNFTDVV